MSITIKIPKTGFVNLSNFEKLIDISKIMYYDLTEDNGVLTLKFFDKRKKLVKPYGQEKEIVEKVTKKVRKNKKVKQD